MARLRTQHEPEREATPIEHWRRHVAMQRPDPGCHACREFAARQVGMAERANRVELLDPATNVWAALVFGAAS